MNIYFTSVLVSLISVNCFAQEILKKEVNYYNPAGEKLREEKVFSFKNGSKELVAKKTIVDGTGEVKELWSKDLGTSSAYGNLKNNQKIKAYFDKAAIDEQIHPADIELSRKSSLADCSMSDDEKTISCPHGFYKKESSVSEDMRQAGKIIKEDGNAGTSETAVQQ